MNSVKPEVPVANIYFLLSYAWKYLKNGAPIPMPAGKCENLTNLFALLLARGILHEIRRGIPRDYRDLTEETPRLRGRVQLADSLSRQTQIRGRMLCTFDDLSHDTPANQVLLATAELLMRNSALENDNRAKLGDAIKWLRGISKIQLSTSVFRRLQIPRHNRSYRFLLNVCELLFHYRLPGEGIKSPTGGDPLLQEVLRDEIGMPRLFEAFVKNFYFEKLPDHTVHAPKIKWSGRGGLDEISAVHLPELCTDVMIEGKRTKVILDCKFYKEALKGGQYSDKVTGGHLFQLLAYLQNAKLTRRGWDEVKPRGILLYPVVKQHLDLRYELLGFPIQIRSVDLTQPWQHIQDEMLYLIHEMSSNEATGFVR